MALAGVITALLSPVCGAIADFNGRRKYWLGASTLILVASSALLWFGKAEPHYAAFILTCVVVGTISLNLSMVFYNAMLPSLAGRKYTGRISGWGWGLGYFGGLVILVIVLYGFVAGKPHWLNTATFEQVRICGPLVAVWTGLFALPLFLLVPDDSVRRTGFFSGIRLGLKELAHTARQMLHQKSKKNILIFLVAQMIYTDGLGTLFAFGGIYAAGTFHMQISEVLLFGIVMNAFAGLGSMVLAQVDDWMGAKFTILLSLFFLTVTGLGIVLITNKTGFWTLGCILALFVGPVQSSSRSLMAQLIPKKKTTEMFGFYILSGKVSTFLGPWLVGSMTLYFNSQRIGMGSMLAFFVLGGIVLHFVPYHKTKTITNDSL